MKISDLILVAFVSGITTCVAFTVLWWLYLRKLLDCLNQIQKNLQSTQRFLATHQESLEKIRSSQKTLIDTVSVKNEPGDLLKEIREIESIIGPAERERIIRYLRSEGFIP